MDSELIKQGIINFIDEEWTYLYGIRRDNIAVEYKGDSYYIAICTYYQEGYGGDIRGRIIITFRDVMDVSDNYPYDDDPWCSAYVDVASVKIDAIDTVHEQDLYYFSELAQDMRDCLKTIYSDISAEGKLDFYVRNH